MPPLFCRADLNPLWMAAGAQFTVAGQGSGQRTVAARDFFLGYRKVDLAPHEVLVKVRKRCNCVTAGTAASQAIGLGLIGWLSQGGLFWALLCWRCWSR